MPISQLFERLGRAVLESPFNAQRASQDFPELAEVRLIVLDKIKEKSHRVAGKPVFPFNLIRIRLSGVPEQHAGTLSSAFLAKYLDDEVRAGLLQFGCRFPDDLRFDIQTEPDLPRPGQTWISVETEMETTSPPPTAKSSQSLGVLLIKTGNVGEGRLPLIKTRTNIGRTAEVFRTSGPSRQNDVAFTGESSINQSVSREHAHILFEKDSGEYRLFNDRWYPLGSDAEANCGLWIVRNGLSQPVHRNSRGIALQDGDEIHFGRAVASFALEPLLRGEG